MLAFATTHQRAVLSTLGIVTGLAVSTAIYYCTRYDPVRYAAWEQQVKPRLNRVEEQSREDVRQSVEQVRAFFAERRQGARGFASDVLSLGGKWAYVKDFYDAGAHDRFIEESFVRNIFSPDELRTVVDSAVSSCVSKLQGRENQLLVDIRADLSDGELASPDRLPALLDEVAFRQQYEAMLDQVMPIVSRDLGYTVTREMVAFVGSEIATQILAEIATTIAVRLGISGGILGTGAYSGAVTFGAGLIVGILVDMALDWAIRQAGYDPEGEIAAKVCESLNHLEQLVIDGAIAAVPAANGSCHFPEANWDRLCSDPIGEIQDVSGRAWDSAKSAWNGMGWSRDATDYPGMRGQLEKLDEARSRLRKEALRAMILEGGSR